MPEFSVRRPKSFATTQTGTAGRAGTQRRWDQPDVLQAALDLGADYLLTFSGGLLSVLYEEAPITPRRMLLVQLGMLLGGGQLLLLWHVPRMYALAVLFLLNLVIILTMWHFARHAMKQLVWGGSRYYSMSETH